MSDNLPIKLDTTSNGEFEPIPLDALSRQASALARETTARHSKRLGVSRRQFLL